MRTGVEICTVAQLALVLILFIHNNYLPPFSINFAAHNIKGLVGLGRQALQINESQLSKKIKKRQCIRN